MSLTAEAAAGHRALWMNCVDAAALPATSEPPMPVGYRALCRITPAGAGLSPKRWANRRSELLATPEQPGRVQLDGRPREVARRIDPAAFRFLGPGLTDALGS